MGEEWSEGYSTPQAARASRNDGRVLARRTRRRLLGEALVAGVGAATFLRWDEVEAHAADSDVGDPGFVAGKVVAYDGDTGVLTVLNDDSVEQTLVVESTTDVWKQGLVNIVPPSAGDCVYGRGTPNAAGVISAVNVWIDIGSLDVTVLSVRSSSISVRFPSGDEASCKILPITRILTPNGFVTGTSSPLQPGGQVTIIGFGDPSAGTYAATTIYPWAPPGATSSDPDPWPSRPGGSSRDPDVNCPYTYVGLASFFCCGGVQGCGSNCSNKGSNGACGTCRSTKHQIAWPQLDTGCDVQCCGGCCPSPRLPVLPCGKQVTVTNQCNSKSVTTTVADCGPCVHCETSGVGCKSYRTVKFDLTPCAFSAIGSLSTGLIDVQCEVFLRC